MADQSEMESLLRAMKPRDNPENIERLAELFTDGAGSITVHAQEFMRIVQYVRDQKSGARITALNSALDEIEQLEHAPIVPDRFAEGNSAAYDAVDDLRRRMESEGKANG